MVNYWNTELQDILIEFINSSNFIGHAGSSWVVTYTLCRQVFKGCEAVIAHVEPGTPEYAKAEAALIRFGRPCELKDIIRSRQEVINHAGALMCAIEYVLLNSLPVTEDLLKEIHRRLCAEDILDLEGVEIGGAYRDWPIAARHGEEKSQRVSRFVHERTVPEYMKELIADLQKDMEAIEHMDKTVNPYEMASRYCHRLIRIHPFRDGNGRLCRILLNVLLLKYAGHVSIFGGTEEQREEYLNLSHQANGAFWRGDMVVPEEEKKGHHELQRLTQAGAVEWKEWRHQLG
ncbi:fido domain-containing protein [Xylariales sp. AK1849]|nr:fido domain-containing protein [Xylariales sp. AK1849]